AVGDECNLHFRIITVGTDDDVAQQPLMHGFIIYGHFLFVEQFFYEYHQIVMDFLLDQAVFNVDDIVATRLIEPHLHSAIVEFHRNLGLVAVVHRFVHADGGADFPIQPGHAVDALCHRPLLAGERRGVPQSLHPPPAAPTVVWARRRYPVPGWFHNSRELAESELLIGLHDFHIDLLSDKHVGQEN